MTMRLFFMATINIGANNGHGCNVQTTKESSLFHASFAFYFMPTIYIILPFPSLSSHRQHYCHHVQKTKQRSPVYFLPPSVTLQEKRNSKSLPAFRPLKQTFKAWLFQQNILHSEQNTRKRNFVHLAGQNLSVAIPGISVVAKFASHFAHFDRFSGSPSNLCRKVGWAIWLDQLFETFLPFALIWWFCYWKKKNYFTSNFHFLSFILFCVQYFLSVAINHWKRG